MSTLALVLSVIMAVIGILLCVIILLQSNRAAGLGTIGGGSSNSDSYWSKNKGNSVEGTLARYTKIGGAIFLILGIVINYIHWYSRKQTDAKSVHFGVSIISMPF